MGSLISVMTENLNQLREKKLLGVKYDYNEWSDVNSDYLLVSVIVINKRARLEIQVD
ncbi:MAG: hypothetical protein ACI971_001344 [Colwellia sp.]|jgi:hypothetical protein